MLHDTCARYQCHCYRPLVSAAWSIWYLRAESEKTHRGRKRFLKWRWSVLILPIAALILCVWAFQQEDYSALCGGGGPLAAMVVFDSKPRGATVRFAWVVYAYTDPWLEKNDAG